MAKLTITLDDAPPAVHDLDGGEGDVVTIGRVSDNDIQIDDASVSSHHAQLECDGDVWSLKDLNSTNGTRRNGETIGESRLEDGDELRIGKIVARYEIGDPGESKPLPEAGKVAASLGEDSRMPSDFENASPFKQKAKKKDPFGMAAMLVAILAILAIAGVGIQLFTLAAPQ